MNNSVSSRLTEKTADEIIQYLYQPYMDMFDEVALERMCALNEAHVAVLHNKNLITPEIAKQLLAGIRILRDRGVPPVSGKLSAALLFLYFSGGRDRTMIWDTHRNARRLC